MIKIDKGVPVPEKMGNKYPFSEMEVGDSFYVDGATPNQLQNAASYWRKKAGYKFVARRENEGARIWRIE